MCERCTVHHGRHANGDNRHAECFLVERRTGVSHAGPRRNAGICQLHRTQQPRQPTGGKRIHGDDSGRAHAVEHTADDLAGLDAGLSEHTRSQCGNGPPVRENSG